MADQLVECVYDGGVVTLTMCRAPRNLMNIDMMEQMNDALLEFRDHPELKVLLIRGQGDTFCAGVDPADHTRARVTRMLQMFHRIFETMRLVDAIAIAAVHGDALGGGFELALGCNMILASDAAKFSLPQIDMGVFPPLASVVLPRAGPRRKAMEWILTGAEIPAAELEKFGLVNHVYSAAEFEERVREFAFRLIAKSGPILQLARRAQVEAYYATYEEALYKVENLYLRNLMSLSDSHEGIQAELEHRAPEWRDS